MEGQGKRLLLAVGLALGVMLVWNMVFPPKKEDPKKPDVALVGSGAGGAGSGGAMGTVVPKVAPCIGESFDLPFQGRFVATFSECGGSLTGWRLLDPKFEKDETKGQLLALGQPGAGSFLVSFPRSTADVSHQEKWTIATRSQIGVTFTLKTPFLDLAKTFEVMPGAYSVRVTIAVTPTQVSADQQLAVSVFAYQDPKGDIEGGTQVAGRAWSSSTLRVGSEHTIETNFSDLMNSPRHETNVRFTGFEHPYLLTAYAPKRDTATIEKWSYALAEPSGLMRTDLLFPVQKLEVGKTATYELVGFLGPKLYNELKNAEREARFAPGFESIVDFGWFGIIGRPLHWLLGWLYGLVGNWGIAIMLLTFIVKLITLYPVTRSMRSMKAMASLAPQMKALQERYKDDRQRQQSETMALYKQHGVNPVAGCLPMLMQMPVWIALYRMLSSAGELYREPFINGWISDLTAPDPFHVLPVVLTITMFAQARLTPATGTNAQQKMLQYGMPLGFGVMSFFFPAGLTLYIFTNTVLGALHSIYMNKFDKKSKAIAARMAAAAPAVETKDKTAVKAAVAKAKPVADVERDADGGDDNDSSATPSSSSGAARPGPRNNSQRNKPKRNKR